MNRRAPLLAAMALALSACAFPLDQEPDAPDEPPPDSPGGPATPRPPSPWTSTSARPPGRPPALAGSEEMPAWTGEPEMAAVVAGWTDDGEVVLFDADTGAALAVAPGSDLGGERDLAFDPWRSRLIVFQSDAFDPWGEIAGYPVTAGDLDPWVGPRIHEVWVDGVARVAGSPFGTVVFEESYGPRWRLVRSDGEPSSSVYAPRPASLATGLSPDGELRLTALTYGAEGDAADVRVALVEPEGVTAPVVVPLSAAPASSPLAARWVESAGGGQLVDVDAGSGDIVVSTFAGGGWPPWMAAGVGPGIERVEQAAALPGGGRLALLVTGAVDLVVVGVGAGGAPECAAALDLPGEVDPAGLFFARGVVAVGPDRLLVATSSGVAAVTVSDDCPPALAVDPGFDGEALRGPLDRAF